MYTTPPSPPLEEITPDNHGAIVSIIAFVFLSFSIIVVVVKAASSLYLKRTIISVDAPIWVCTIVAFIQSLLIQFAVDHGLGKHTDALSRSDFEAYNKLNYAAQLLLIVVLSLSKVSTSILIIRIDARHLMRRYCYITQAVIAAWTIFAIFGTALQCRTPRWVYLPNRCVGQGAIAYPITIANLLTDAAIVIIPLAMMWSVKMPIAQRLGVLAAFSSRLLVIVVNIVQISYLPQYLHSTDPTWTVLSVTVCNQVIMNTSIMASCMPALYRVISTLALGLNNVHITEQLELRSGKRSNKSGSESGNRNHNQPSIRTERRSRRSFLGSSKVGSITESGLFVRNLTVARRDPSTARSTESTTQLRGEHVNNEYGMRKTSEARVNTESDGSCSDAFCDSPQLQQRCHLDT